MKKLCLQTLALLMILVLTVSSMCACGVPGSTTVTETPTEASTEVPTETPTETPTEASTEAFTEAPAAAPTEALVQGSPLDLLPEYTYDSYKGLWDVENGEAEMLVYTATSSDGYISYLTDLEKAGNDDVDTFVNLGEGLVVSGAIDFGNLWDFVFAERFEMKEHICLVFISEPSILVNKGEVCCSSFNLCRIGIKSG